VDFEPEGIAEENCGSIQDLQVPGVIPSFEIEEGCEIASDINMYYLRPIPESRE